MPQLVSLRTLAAGLALAGLAACDGGNKDGLGTGDCPDSNTIVLVDANNYHLTTALEIRSTDVKAYDEANPTDYRIDWSAVGVDMQGHPMSPTDDVDLVGMVQFPSLSAAEIAIRIADESLLQSDVGGSVSQNVSDSTETWLSNLTLAGNPVDAPSYLTEDAGVFMVLLASGNTLGVNSRQLHLVQPVAEETNTAILVADDSTTVTVEVDLASLTPARLVADADYFTLDWGALTLNGQGGPIDLGHIDRVEVAWFAEATLTDVEDHFLDVELDADALWQAAIPSGTDVALDELIGDGPFPGISTDGTWLLGLSCTTCANPAPKFFTVLTPCTPE